MSDEELEAQIDKYVSEHGCKRIEAEAAILVYGKAQEKKEVKKKPMYSVPSHNRDQIDLLELEQLADEYGWSPEEADAFFRWFKVERKRRFIEAMQKMNQARH